MAETVGQYRIIHTVSSPASASDVCICKYLCETERDAALESNPGKATPSDNQQHQPQQESAAVSGTSSTPTPPDERAAQQNDDYDTDDTESELALSEPPTSPSPPVHDEFSDHRPAMD